MFHGGLIFSLNLDVFIKLFEKPAHCAIVLPVMADSNQHQLEGEIFHEDLIFLSIQMVT
jgi:hypothetical protein